jgi:hypothetical protein
MNHVTTWLLAAVAGVFVVAVVVALWEHFQRIDDLRRQLDGSEESRFALEHRASVVEARVNALVQTVGARHLAANAASREVDARRAVLDQALSRMAAPTVNSATAPITPEPEARPDFEGSPWAETQPLVGLGFSPSQSPAYAPTMPAELDQLVASGR